MTILKTQLDTATSTFRANHEGLLQLNADHRRELDLARAGGGDAAQKRHHDKGKLMPRERIELLLDLGAPFLELSPLAGWGSTFPVGGSVVTGIGVVSGVECVIIAHDPTVRGGAINPPGMAKTLRAMEIARSNRLPLITLVESAGADLPSQVDLFIPGGQIFRNLTRLSAEGVPTVALVFGSSTAGGAYMPGLSDHSVLVDGQAKVFLGGPPLVRMATGEVSTDEELGGARMHSRVSGLADHFAVDEQDCIRIGRQIVADLGWVKRGPGPTEPADPPLYDSTELLGLAPVDLKHPFDPREVIARIVDGSRFSEYKAQYGTSLVTGWASLHGFRIGILANARGVLFSEESEKATEFIQLANRSDTPLLFLQNCTGFMVGRDYEQGGIVKDGAKMINAVSNSKVPHLTVEMAASYGAANYAMCGRAYDPRFLFSWPNSRTALMGPEQLAGVMSIIAEAGARAAGRPFDADADAERTEKVRNQIENESHAFFTSGKVFDDGVIDPRDTRTVLGLALSAIHSAEVVGSTNFGVFRM